MPLWSGLRKTRDFTFTETAILTDIIHRLDQYRAHSPCSWYAFHDRRGFGRCLPIWSDESTSGRWSSTLLKSSPPTIADQTRSSSSFEISFNGGADFVGNDLIKFTYSSIPTVLGASKIRGSVTGGDFISMETSFVTNDISACRFGVLTAEARNSGAKVLCATPEAPALRPITSMVTLGVGNDTAKHSGILFQFHNQPAIARVVPIKAPASGGTVITIEGFNLFYQFGLQIWIINYQGILVQSK